MNLHGTQRADTSGEGIPEDDLLDYFARHHEQMATFMALTMEELDAEDRRKLAFAQINAVKRAYIRAGEPIPAALFELERRFVGA